jgi:hypothetical protein
MPTAPRPGAVAMATIGSSRWASEAAEVVTPVIVAATAGPRRQ